MNEDVQAGTRGLKYAAAKGLGVIVMEPLFGGTLANPPRPIREIWDAAGSERHPGRRGLALAVEQTGSVAGPQRHEYAGAGEAEPGTAPAGRASAASAMKRRS